MVHNVVNKEFLSLVIASYNCIDKLRETLENLPERKKDKYEVIIVDGNSTDGTVEFLESSKQNFHEKIRFISEPDEGIADAWNKGVEMACGRYVCFLNCGDFLSNDFIEEIYKTAADESVIYFCDTVKLSNAREILSRKCSRDPKFGGLLLSNFGFAHPGCVVSCSLLKKYKFDSNKKVGMDTDFLIKCFFDDTVSFEKSGGVAFYETGGTSDVNFLLGQKEYYSSLKQHLDRYHQWFYIAPYLLTLLRSIKNKIQFFKFLLKPIKHLMKRFINLFLSIIPTASWKAFVLNRLGSEVAGSCTVCMGVTFTQFKKLKIGEFSIINAGCYLDARGELKIGCNVNIMRDVKILTAGHNIHSPFFELTLRPTVINDSAVIFSNSLINPGINIGYGAVILPGSVVTKDVGSYEIWGGNPAQKLSNRNKRCLYTNNYKQVFGL